MHPHDDMTISPTAQRAAAAAFGCDVESLEIVSVHGGYSRNRRALVGYGDHWLFAKEVDTELLPDDGAQELGWLHKDAELVELLRSMTPDFVVEQSTLVANGHVLLMSCYRQTDGWTWMPPSHKDEQQSYIQAVIDATKRLESLTFTDPQITKLNLQPYFRDQLANDNGFETIINDPLVREQLDAKCEHMKGNKSLAHLHNAFTDLQSLLKNEARLKSMSEHAKRLTLQPNDCFGHCDVRSDNIAFNQNTAEIKFVDWNWASMTPAKFGSTEFLTDMARRGLDVSSWIGELNIELLAATVSYYASRCLKEPLSPQSTLRDMQAESAAVTLQLYEMATRR